MTIHYLCDIISSAVSEGWPSGWRRSIGNAVMWKHPWVQIPSLPPYNDFKFYKKLESLFFLLKSMVSAFLCFHRPVLELSRWWIFVCFKKTYYMKRFLMAQKVFLWYKKISYDGFTCIFPFWWSVRQTTVKFKESYGLKCKTRSS